MKCLGEQKNKLPYFAEFTRIAFQFLVLYVIVVKFVANPVTRVFKKLEKMSVIRQKLTITRPID